MKRSASSSLSWHTLHRWAGAALALYVVCACVTGLVLQYKDELLALRYPSLRAPATPTSTEIDRAVTRLRSTFSPIRITHARLPADEASYYRLWLTDGRQAIVRATDLVTLEHGGDTRSVLAFLEALHTHLLVSDAGKVMVGVAGLFILGLLISAIGTWLPFAPHTRPSHLRLRQLSRPHLNRFHRMLGIAAWPVCCLIVVTGVMVAFGDTSAGLLRGVLGGSPYPPPPSLESCPARPAPLADQIDAAQRAFPDARLSMLILPSACERAPGFRFRRPGEWHPEGTSFVYLDPESTMPLVSFSADSLGTGTAVAKRIFPLHAGAVGGPLMLALLSFGALAMTVLSITGLAAFLQWLLPGARQRRAAGPMEGRPPAFENRDG